MSCRLLSVSSGFSSRSFFRAAFNHVTGFYNVKYRRICIDNIVIGTQVDILNQVGDEYENNEYDGNNGGSLGEFTKGQMVPEFDDAVFKMNVGEITGPVKTQFGYHLIKLNAKNDAKTFDFDEIKEYCLMHHLRLSDYVANYEGEDIFIFLKSVLNSV